MLNIPRTDADGNLTNLVFSPSSSGVKGTKGRIEVYLRRDDETGEERLVFVDIGGYGRERWHAEIILTSSVIERMQEQFAMFVEGISNDTRVEIEQVSTTTADDDADRECIGADAVQVEEVATITQTNI